MAAASLFRPLRNSILLLLLLTGLGASAQIDNVYVYGTVKDYNTSKKLDNVTVTVFKDGAKLTSVVTRANGKYEFNLDYGYDYKLMFDKPGMVGKNVNIDTRNIPDEDRQGGMGMNIEMTLFADLPGLDFKLLDQPIGKCKYDPEKHMLAWDLDYTEQIRSEMARLLKDYDDRKKREANLEEDFKKAMAQGTDAMAKGDFKKAVGSFTDALGMKPEDPIATAKLSDAKIKFNEQEQNRKQDEKYAGLVKEADGLFNKKNYADAKAKYAAAQDVKRDEPYPAQKIKECDAFIADLAKKAEEEKKAKELQDKYDAAVAAGDAAFKAEQYDVAKTKFTEAAGLKPDEKYPPEQLAAITAKEAELAKKAEEEKKAKELEDQYNAAIAAADAAFKSASYDAAKAKYNEALGLKPKEKYPADQLKAIDQKLAELAQKAEEEKKAKALNDQYNAAIAAADAAFQSANYDEAKTQYNAALDLKPKEEYPTDQLAAIAAKLDELAKQAEAEKKAKELDAQYNAVIADADAAMQGSDYDGAKKKYNEALGLKPDEQYPKDQLAAIDKALAEIAAKAEAEKKAKELQDQYDAVVDKAEKLFSNEKYEDAKAKFQEALGLKPDEAHPKERIVEIDAKLDELARQAEEQRKQEALEAKYTGLIASADKKFDAKNNSEALKDYQDASQLKPDEQYPKDRIAAIGELLDAKAQAQAEKERLEREKQQKEAQYADLVAKADADFTAKDYTAATSGYNAALEVKPGEKHPTERLAEIKQLLAAQAAADSAKAAEDAAERARLAEEARKQAEADSLKAAQDAAEQARLAAERENAAATQARYDSIITLADGAFDDLAYDQARSAYTEALGVKPDEQYPKDRIAAIDEALAQLDQARQDSLAAAEKARLAEAERRKREAAEADSAQAALDRAEQKRKSQQALDEQYAKIILEADKAMAEKDYTGARGSYAQALDIKPKETYPQVKMDQIDKLLAEQARLEKERQQAQEKPEPPPAPVASNTTDNRKEQEAEEFMREAREREEAEKYDRIKRQMAAVEDQKQELATKADTRHEEASRTYEDYVQSADQLYTGSEAMRKRNAAELEAFREALEQRRKDLRERGVQESGKAVAAAGAQAEQQQQLDAERREQHSAKVDAVLQEQQAVAARKQSDANAAKERREAARQQLQQQEQHLADLGKRGNAAADALRADMDRMKAGREAREQQMASRARDRSTAAKERLDNTPPNRAKPYTDYNRNTLASKYPQGVTEESYTEGNKVIIRRVVVQGNKADEYSKVIAKWGTFYFKNGQSISEQIWTVNTEQ